MFPVFVCILYMVSRISSWVLFPSCYPLEGPVFVASIEFLLYLTVHHFLFSALYPADTIPQEFSIRLSTGTF